MKKLAIALGAFLGLLLVAMIAIPLFVDVDHYRPQIIQAANQNLNGKLELGKLKLSLWGEVRINVAGMTLLDSRSQALLSVKDAYFQLPLLALLRGQPEANLKLRAPTLSIVRTKDGKINLLSLLEKGKPAESGAPATSGAAGTAAPSKSGGSSGVPGVAAAARLNIDLFDATLSFRDDGSGAKTQLTEVQFRIKDLSLSRPTEIEFVAQSKGKVGTEIDFHGPIRWTAHLAAVLEAGQFKELLVKSKLNLDEWEVEQKGMFKKDSSVPLHLEIAASVSPSLVKVEKLAFRFLNAEISGQGTLQQSPQVAKFDLKSNAIALQDWVKPLSLQGPVATLKGTIGLEAHVQGPTDRLGYGAQLNVALTTGASDLEVVSKVASAGKPWLQVKVKSKNFDLDAFAGTGGSNAKSANAKAGAASPAGGGKSGAQAKADLNRELDPIRKNAFLQSTSAEISIEMSKLKASGMVFTPLQGKIAFKNGVLALDQWKIGLWSGTILSSMQLQTRPLVPTYKLSAEVKDLDLAQAVASQMEAYKNTVLGKAQFKMTAQGASLNTDEALKQLQAKGHFRIDRATFTSIDVGKMVSEAVSKTLDRVSSTLPALKGKSVGNIPSGKTQYEYFNADFTIASGWLDAPNFVGKVNANEGFDIKGRTKLNLLDNRVDAAWEIVDTYGITHLKDISVEQAGVHVDHIFAEGDGPVRFPVTVGCTTSKPCYSYAQVPEHFLKVATDNVGAAVAREARKKVESAVQNQIQQALPPAMKDSLKGLFH